ncbi:MAG TPA: putative zinc-binding metallopeptidase [Candidatus Omnitrophota bacterium]|nr:putative zinc-binding metallopeptidase [Candidatus Omnitrophota bacterium]
MKKKKLPIDLNVIPEEDLLKTRLCDLPVTIEGTWVKECVDQLYQELSSKGILFNPVCYWADEWLTPEGETCIGVPFYLAHPRLMQLEKKMMEEVEGGTKADCMKLLRHEAGHAICYAYKLNKRREWQNIFGLSTEEYKDTYKYQRYSKNYVHHLKGFYAQYHPDEDFVETFAVWLTPDTDWQKKYQGWRASQKLDYVDHLMRSIKGKKPLCVKAHQWWRLATLKITLENYYKKRRISLAEEFPDFHDNFLKKVFLSPSLDHAKKAKASVFFQQYRIDLIEAVSAVSSQKKYLIEEILTQMEKRAKALRLEIKQDDIKTILQTASYLTALMMNYFYVGRLRPKKAQKRK